MSWDDAWHGVDRDTPGAHVPRALRLGLRMQAAPAANEDAASHLPAYAELHALSEFTFLRGAASAEAMFARAARLGYEALAITDECSLSGIVQALEASEATGLKLITGAEFTLDDGLKLVLLVQDLPGYQRLCRIITEARRAAPKGDYSLTRGIVESVLRGDGDSRGKVEAASCGLFALWIPGATPCEDEGRWLRAVFGERAFLAIELLREGDDHARLAQLLALANHLQLTPVASGDVHMVERSQRRLQDVVTAIRLRTPLAQAGLALHPNGERHLRTRRALANIYPRHLLQAAVQLAARCHFNLREVNYVYPRELVPAHHTPSAHLRALTLTGMRERWPHGTPFAIRRQIAKELALIAQLRYEAFFLTVHDIVVFARGRGILCQGRGSSANSVVCYALGITAVNPEETRLLMARFLSTARGEPPDIDVDFEHERREEVLQYIYAKYGRGRAALAATVIRYRGKSAVRDAAFAFGLPEDQISLLASCMGWGNAGTPLDTRLAQAGFDSSNPLIQRVLKAAAALEGKPRHLSQHVGGFVISDAPLWQLVPVENAAMPDRTIIQWEKDDLETLGLLKVDCLALGMLTCIRKAFDLIAQHHGRTLTLATLPRECHATFDMVCLADTVGVFQIESRAQMAMLPRLKPRCYHDLVVQVAIVRPGPIQGGMVHPYLRRRMKQEPVSFPSKGVQAILGHTLGVPLFQEQVMELVIHAGYTEAEADGLRKSMAAWRRGGDMERHRLRIRELMQAKGYDDAFIEQMFEQIKGFGSYGFPQSHAASFAHLVYASCWLKRHYPAAFACALLNAQPMGFYSPSQIVQDARRGSPQRAPVSVLPVDVLTSDWDNILVGEESASSPRVRLGLRQVAGLSETTARRLIAARSHFNANTDTFRANAPTITALCEAAALDARSRRLLTDAGAFASLEANRHAARWQVSGIERATPLLLHSAPETAAALPAPNIGEDVLADYRATGLTLAAHPLSLLRTQLAQRRIRSSAELLLRHHGALVHTAGLVTQRQRPATAKGTIFLTLEDEFGMVNVVVWKDLAARFRLALLGARLLGVRGRWEHVDGVRHLIAGHLEDLSPLLGGLAAASRDFR